MSGQSGISLPRNWVHLLDTLLADLPETGKAIPDRAEVAIPGGISVVEFDTPQSVALFGHAGHRPGRSGFLCGLCPEPHSRWRRVSKAA